MIKNRKSDAFFHYQSCLEHAMPFNPGMKSHNIEWRATKRKTGIVPWRYDKALLQRNVRNKLPQIHIDMRVTFFSG